MEKTEVLGLPCLAGVFRAQAAEEGGVESVCVGVEQGEGVAWGDGDDEGDYDGAGGG